MSYLDDELFRSIVSSTPLVAVDLIFASGQQVLLGKRSNKPAQGYWFVPGGRILKDDTIAQTIERVAREEIGCDITGIDPTLIGAYEHHYQDNVFADPGFGTHYVVLAYLIGLDEASAAAGDEQHDELRWWNRDDAMQSPDVHEYSRIYLQKLTTWK